MRTKIVNKPLTPQVTEASGATTNVTFDVNLTSVATTDTVVTYAVTPNVDYLSNTAGKVFFSSADFGGTLPTGTVTIAAGETDATVTISIPDSALGSATDKWLGISIATSGSNPIYDPTAQIDVVNSSPVAGTAAQPAFDLLASSTPVVSENPSTLIQSGSAYTLNLGQVLLNAALPSLQFAIANLAAVPADSLSALISGETGNGFQMSGSEPTAAIAAGSASQNLYFQPVTTTLGAQSETLTLSLDDVNDTGYSASLPDLTLTLEDTIIAPAQASVNVQSLVLPNVRAGTSDSKAIIISNSAAQGAANLDVTATAGTRASVSGSISQLAPGATDSTDILVGLATGAAGHQTGTVTLNLASDLGNGVTVPVVQSPGVSVIGSVYREASAEITAPETIVHVGDTGLEALTVTNSAAADGYSENLIASISGTAGALGIGADGSTGEIAAGASNSTSLGVSFSTAQAGTISGTASLALTSDGGLGTGTIDGLGQIALAPETVPIDVTVNNYAVAALAEVSGGGTFTQTGTNSDGGNAYTLDLGSVLQGSSPITVDLEALNIAAGPADTLAGIFETADSSAFNNALGSFSDLAPGSSDPIGSVALDTGTTGSFTETVTFDPTGSNASGYSGALADETLTIKGTVASSAPASIEKVSQTPAFGDLGIGATVTLTLTSSEAVTVTGTPTLSLNDGGIATFDPVNSTATSLVFNYMVGASDNSVSSLAATSINLNGGTIADGAGNAANLSLTGLTQTGPEIDTVTPTITSVIETPSSGDLGVGATVAITLKTSEPLTNITGGYGTTLSLNDGGVATYDPAASTSSSFVFDYTVGAGQNTSSLAVTAVNLNGVTAEDASGNPVDTSLSGLTQAGPEIDTTSPTITSVTETPASGDLGVGSKVAITLTTSGPLTNITGGYGTTLSLNDGGVATYDVAASTSSAFVFDYTVGAGETTPSLAVTAVNLNGVTASDAAGNPINLSLAGLTQAGPEINITTPVSWTDSGDNWTTASDWSSGTVPGIDDDLTIGEGEPAITSSTPAVNTVTVAGAGQLSSSGGSLATTSDFTNSGAVYIDAPFGGGGSSIEVGGALINNGHISIGSSNLSLPDEVSAASLTNANSDFANIYLEGNAANQARLDISGAAGFGTAGVVSGGVYLTNNAEIEFGSGSIRSIQNIGVLSLDGAQSLVADASDPGTNGALTGLSSNAGILSLANGAAISTNVDFTNTDVVTLDDVYGDGIGGSSFIIGGRLTNSGGAIYIGNNDVLSASDKVSATALTNTNDIDITGSSKAASKLLIAGAAENDGTIDEVSYAKVEIGGAVTGSGSFEIGSHSCLELGASVASGQSITFSGSDASLTLDKARKFSGDIEGFEAGDSIDLKNIAFNAHNTLGYSQNSTGTGGTLSIGHGSHIANIALLGNYMASSFVASSDGHGGTLITDPSTSQQALLAQPHA